MSYPVSDRRPETAGDGVISRTLVRWFFRAARVADAAELSPRIRQVTLEGESLKTVSWRSGQKVQISVGPGLTWRTYTPIEWDEATGRTVILAFAHGDGPGSRWTTRLKTGDPCALFGPRRSLDLSELTGHTILFGDETSFGLAAAIGSGLPRQRVSAFFETSDAIEASLALDKVGLGDASVFQGGAGGEHLDAMSMAIRKLASVEAGHILLTGKATSIQHISRSLKSAGLGSRIKAKAYWAPGKAGLD